MLIVKLSKLNRFCAMLLVALASFGFGTGHATIITSGSVSPSGIGPGDTNTSALTVGGDFSTPGVGSITIDNGNTLTIQASSPFVNIAPLAGSSGTVTVTGKDVSGTKSSTLRVEGTDGLDGAFLTVGRGGTGNLNILNGAKVQIDSLGAPLARNIPGTGFPAGFQIGRNAGSQGTVNISGTDSELSLTSDFAIGRIGRDGSGQMNITNGGKLSFTGKNSDFNVSSDIFIPTNGQGVLNVNTGGSVSGPVFMDVGGSQGGEGTVNLDGPTSSISLSGACTPDCPPGFSFQNQGAFLTVGANQGTGQVNITNGAKFTIDSTQTPNAEFSGFSLGGSSILGPMGNGTLVVDGVGSELRVAGDRGFLSVGRLQQGQGALTISNGGQVIMENSDGRSRGFLGDRPGAIGNISVDGATSLLDVGNSLNVGVDQSGANAGNGIVTLQNGGTVKADNILLGMGGTIQGNGTLAASTSGSTQVRLGNLAAISPGLSTGELVIEGDLVVVGGRFILEADSLLDFDMITVTGDAMFDGGILDIVLSFVPDPSDIFNFFNILGTTTITSAFEGIMVSNLQGAGIPGGTALTVALGGSTFTSQTVSVPEPSTLLIFVFGIVALTGFRRFSS